MRCGRNLADITKTCTILLFPLMLACALSMRGMLWLQAQDAEEVQKLIDTARQTPKGHKKDVGGEMFKGYTPAAVEAGW